MRDLSAAQLDIHLGIVSLTFEKAPAYSPEKEGWFVWGEGKGILLGTIVGDELDEDGYGDWVAITSAGHTYTGFETADQAARELLLQHLDIPVGVDDVWWT